MKIKPSVFYSTLIKSKVICCVLMNMHVFQSYCDPVKMKYHIGSNHILVTQHNSALAQCFILQRICQ